MKRRHFILGLGSASIAGTSTVGTAASHAPRDQGRNRNNQTEPVTNIDTETSYDSISDALREASPGHTIQVALGTTFEETISIDTDNITLEATGNSRLTVDGRGGVRSVEETGNSRAEIDDDVELLIVETSGNARPSITGEVDAVVLESKGNSQPKIDTDLDELLLVARGNASPIINGDVGRLTVETRGNAAPEINGNVGEYTDGPGVSTQPLIKGGVKIAGDGVVLDGFDIDVDDIGIDIHPDSLETVQVSNNAIFDARDATTEEGVLPEEGVGIRVTTNTESEAVTIGGDHGQNFVTNNDLGLLVRTTDDEIADADTTTILENNTFSANHVSLVPDPGDPKASPDPLISTDAPPEVLVTTQEDQDVITAELPNVSIDDDESMRMLSLSVNREEDGPIEFVFDPTDPSEVPPLPAAYEFIDEGTFTIDTSLEQQELDAVRFTFVIDRDQVRDPDAVTLQRAVEDGFEPLRTVLVGESPSSYQYAAISPGFSIFTLTEFNEGGVGGAGRELDGTLILPEHETNGAGGVDEIFIRIEASEAIDNLDFTPTDAAVDIDDSITIDLSAYSAEDLPENFGELFTITNDGTESVTLRTHAGLSHVDFFNIPEGQDSDLVDLDGTYHDAISRYTGIAQDAVRIWAKRFQLNSGQSVSSGLSISSTDPANQLWVTLGMPSLVDEQSGEPFSASEATETIDSGIHYNCVNHSDAPVLFHSQFGYGDSDGWWITPIGASGEDWTPDDSDEDLRYLRVPAFLSVNWYGESQHRDGEQIDVRIDATDGPEGSLVGIYDKDGLIGDEGDVLTPPIRFSYSEADFGDGAVKEEIDLVFESNNNCDPSGPFNIVTMDRVYDNIGDLELSVGFEGDNRWADITARDEVRSVETFHTLGETTTDLTNELLEETFQTFVEGVVSAAMPGPVMTYRVARAMMTGGRSTTKGVEYVAIWSGIDTLTRNQALTPQSLFSERFAEGVTAFDSAETATLPSPFPAMDLDLGFVGPTVYVSDDTEPICIDPDVRTLSVEGQVTGGPVILMGLDSELVPGSPNHGPPDEHAAMVASILDSVTNDGEGILVLGGDPDRNSDIIAYWEGDVASDPRVDEDVTFVNGADNIREVEFDGYAMIGIVSSTGQISNGLVDSENQALIDRQHDIAAFVNEGGGLLGKTQDRLSDPWGYISPIVDIQPISASNSSIEVTPAGEELGLTQQGMDGWCCYHESFEEDSVPDFLDVLLRNPEQSGNPPAAIGGDSVVVQTAVDLKSTGPSIVEADVPNDFRFSLANAADEPGDDVRLVIEISREDGIEANDVELSNGGELIHDDDRLVGALTDEPIEFTPDLDTTITRTLTFNENDHYHVEVDVVVDDTNERVVSLPFGIRTVDGDVAICE